MKQIQIGFLFLLEILDLQIQKAYLFRAGGQAVGTSIIINPIIHDDKFFYIIKQQYLLIYFFSPIIRQSLREGIAPDPQLTSSRSVEKL